MIKRRIEITPDLMMRAYRAGLFPMAEGRTADKLYWLDPELRGVLPLDGFHMPRRLMRKVLSDSFTVPSDSDFRGVIAACAAPREGRWNTWINVTIEQLFIELHWMGHAHTIEPWKGGVLVGGLYGV